ncbi:putative mitochondrial pyruvate carrier 2 [Rhypophila sp. PSN 637]
MSAPNTFFRASRPMFRSSQFFSSTQKTSTFRQNASKSSKRFQSTAGAPETAAQESLFKRMWNSPVGFKTVHFWAPVMKWALVLAGVADFARPAEKLSLTQNAALTATGLIWTRWCLIIKPKNYLLAAVNFFLGMVGIVQVSRITMWHQAQKKLEADKTEAPVQA